MLEKHAEEIAEHMTKRFGAVKWHDLDLLGELDFLGLRITRPSDGSIRMDQRQYILAMCEKFSVADSEMSDSPASEDIFEVEESSPPSDDSQRFTSAVMTVMYAALRTKPETLLAVTWLSSRCSAPTQQDDRKLRKLLGYCKKFASLGKRFNPRNLQICAMADASHNAHPDCKGHAGALIGVGGGGCSIFYQSSKIKLQGRSSSEDELYGADKVLSVLQHMTLFMTEIGYAQRAVPLGQDNKSTIVMCEKGHSNDGKARHIKARYFYIKHLIDRGVIRVEYLPTGSMIADIFTKALSGALFRKFRRTLLGEYPAEDETEPMEQ